jgi:galactokinase
MAGPETSLASSFRQQFPDAPSPRLHRAPGRVNLIGEHTDYNYGYVMPIAIQMACHVASAPSPDSCLAIYSENANERREWAWEDVANAQPQDHWTDYVIGVAQELLKAGFRLKPQRLYLRSTVPAGAGLSSSAAIEVASALALLDEQPIEKLKLAQLCQSAERNFVGMPCGIMDQYVSVFGQRHAAIQLDCRSLQHIPVPLPDSTAVVAVNSMVKHELASSAYRERVNECAEATVILGVKSLREATTEQVEAARGRMPDAVFRRARHITSEDERVVRFREACLKGDLQLMGELFVASHRSLQYDYEVSCEELDYLVDTALAIKGVYGARMTGGGFGGCTVNLVKPDLVDEFQAQISARYKERFGVTPDCFVCEASNGAGGE